jgi:4-diphosphocytidyl-2-C-methyl-D-erythritol kinase
VSRSVTLRAHAKVNLTLEVLGRRPDGYHELRSVIARGGPADRVRVWSARAADVRSVPDPASPGHGTAEELEEDLARTALRALARAAGRAERGRIRVRKRIPVGAGLGGGSSDAGAVLRALAGLWGLTEIDLVRVAAEVGSDVPFFASGAAYALISGRGEQVQPLAPPRDPLWMALVTPPHRVRTAEVFAAWREADRNEEGTSARLAAALSSGDVTAALVRECAHNALLPAAERVCATIAHVRERAQRKGIALSLSGSGPSLFAIADDRADALRIARILRRIDVHARAYPLDGQTVDGPAEPSRVRLRRRGTEG